MPARIDQPTPLNLPSTPLSSLTEAQVRERLENGGLALLTPPFRFRIRSNVAGLAATLRTLYADFPLGQEQGFDDFTVSLQKTRPFRPKVHFESDGGQPFEPLPLSQAFPMLEWGFNWCISSHCHTYMITHAAVIEQNGCTIILPAPPGSGKSTLCALLVGHGWRLLSDELALLDPRTGLLTPIPRPISLKNASIELIRQRYPALQLGSLVRDTIKGTVGHFQPPSDSVARSGEPGTPTHVVFPRYRSGASTSLVPLARGAAFIRLAQNTFNYDLLGQTGFEALGKLIANVTAYDFEYQDADDAIARFNSLARGV